MMNFENKGQWLYVGSGHQIYWEETGNRSGDPLLLIHGGSGFTFDMDRFTAARQTDRRIIVMHQRGIGFSRPPGESRQNNLEANIKDIERLREHLGIGKWAVFSWSFGAVLMAGYAFQNRERCAELISYAPYLGSDEDYQILKQKQPELAKDYFALHGAKCGKGIVTSLFNIASNSDRNELFNAYWTALNSIAGEPVDKDDLYNSKSPEDWDLLFKTRLISANLDMELFTSQANFLEKLADRHGHLQIPVTLIYGEQDSWSAPHAYTDKIFPLSHKLIVAGAGHDIHSPEAQEALLPVLTASPLAGIHCFRAINTGQGKFVDSGPS